MEGRRCKLDEMAPALFPRPLSGPMCFCRLALRAAARADVRCMSVHVWEGSSCRVSKEKGRMEWVQVCAMCCVLPVRAICMNRVRVAIGGALSFSLHRPAAIVNKFSLSPNLSVCQSHTPTSAPIPILALKRTQPLSKKPFSS